MSSEIYAEQCPQCGAPLSQAGERITCDYCGSSLVRRSAAGAGEAAPWGVHLRSVVCVDQQGIGIEAFRLLIPATWEFQGGVQWLLNNPGMPVVIAFRTFNPRGYEALEAFPNIPCYWSNNPLVVGLHPRGSLYYGNEVRPPVPALQALRELVVPRYRGQIPGLQIVQQEHLPELARMAQATSPVAPSAFTQADGGRVRLRYRVANQELEEDLFGVVEVTRVPPMPSLFGATEHIFWMADYLFSCRALAGQLERHSDQFLGIVRSFRLNPAWFFQCQQVSQYLIQNQIQHIHQIGRISRMISQQSQQISDSMLASYYQRQEVMDRLSTQFSQTIRGVDGYNDPFLGREVELPGGYRHAWSNALGEYILTDDPNFNPNIGSNLTWEALNKT